MNTTLFSRRDLTKVTDQLISGLRTSVATLQPSGLNDGQTIDGIRQQQQLQPIEFDFAEAEPRISETGTVTVTIPFNGSLVLLEYVPSQWSTVGPSGDVRGGFDQARAVILRTQMQPGVPVETVKGWIQQQKSLLTQWTGFANADAERHNENVDRVLLQAVEERKARIAATEDVNADLGKGI